MAELPRQSGLLNIHIEDNVDWSMVVTYSIGGTPVDVTTYTAKFEIRDKPGQTGTALLALTESAGITVGTTDGIFTVAITDTQAVFGNREMEYDLIVTSAAGVDTKLLRGKCTSYASVVA